MCPAYNRHENPKTSIQRKSWRHVPSVTFAKQDFYTSSYKSKIIREQQCFFFSYRLKNFECPKTLPAFLIVVETRSIIYKKNSWNPVFKTYMNKLGSDL